MGDFVILSDEDDKIIYKIIKSENSKFVLTGLNYRKIIVVNKDEVRSADDDFLLFEAMKTEKYEKKVEVKLNKKLKLGTVLHIDSDSSYLNRCVELYNKVGIYCYPVLTKEADIEEKVNEFDFTPDVVVITGHDFYNGGNIKDISSYTNSAHFVKGVKKIRNKYPNAVIIAGACQSNFEALIANGADFASSPKRRNVHIFDPVVIAIAVSTTSIRKIVDFQKQEKYIEGFKESYSGLETYGKMRMLY